MKLTEIARQEALKALPGQNLLEEVVHVNKVDCLYMTSDEY